MDKKPIKSTKPTTTKAKAKANKTNRMMTDQSKSKVSLGDDLWEVRI